MFSDSVTFDYGFVVSSLLTSIHRRVRGYFEQIPILRVVSQIGGVGVVTPAKCSLKQRVFSLVPVNHVMEGTYLRQCEKPSYDEKKDLLSCTFANCTLILQSPYTCAEDININIGSMQLDC